MRNVKMRHATHLPQDACNSAARSAEETHATAQHAQHRRRTHNAADTQRARNHRAIARKPKGNRKQQQEGSALTDRDDVLQALLDGVDHQAELGVPRHALAQEGAPAVQVCMSRRRQSREQASLMASAAARKSRQASNKYEQPQRQRYEHPQRQRHTTQTKATSKQKDGDSPLSSCPVMACPLITVPSGMSLITTTLQGNGLRARQRSATRH